MCKNNINALVTNIRVRGCTHMMQLGKIRSSSIVNGSKVDNSKANYKSDDAVGTCSAFRKARCRCGRRGAHEGNKSDSCSRRRVIQGGVRGVWRSISSVSSIRRPISSDAKCLSMCCMLAGFRYPRRCAHEQIRTLLHQLVRPSPIVRARWLPMNTHSGATVRGLHKRDKLRVCVGIILDQDTFITQLAGCFADAGVAVRADGRSSSTPMECVN
jgi:hypothetical protein